MRTHVVLYKTYQDAVDFNNILKNSIDVEVLEVTVDGIVRLYKHNSPHTPEVKLILCEGTKEKVLSRLSGETITTLYYLEGEYSDFVINYVESRRRSASE